MHTHTGTYMDTHIQIDTDAHRTHTQRHTLFTCSPSEQRLMDGVQAFWALGILTEIPNTASVYRPSVTGLKRAHKKKKKTITFVRDQGSKH